MNKINIISNINSIFTIKNGFSTKALSYKFNSVKRFTISFNGLRFALLGNDPSNTNNNIFVLSICFKNLCPSPLFCEAPSIRPGKSATLSSYES